MKMTYDEKKPYDDFLASEDENDAQKIKAVSSGIWFEESYQRIYPFSTLACDLIGAIKELYPKALQERYEADPAGKPIEILEAVAESRKCYAKGEQLDLGKAAGILIDDFRSGKLGRITLERI